MSREEVKAEMVSDAADLPEVVSDAIELYANGGGEVIAGKGKELSDELKTAFRNQKGETYFVDVSFDNPSEIVEGTISREGVTGTYENGILKEEVHMDRKGVDFKITDGTEGIEFGMQVDSKGVTYTEAEYDEDYSFVASDEFGKNRYVHSETEVDEGDITSSVQEIKFNKSGGAVVKTTEATSEQYDGGSEQSVTTTRYKIKPDGTVKITTKNVDKWNYDDGDKGKEVSKERTKGKLSPEQMALIRQVRER